MSDPISIYRQLVADNQSKFWNIRDQYKGLPPSALKEIVVNDILPYGVCVVNVTGDLNVGIIIRTAALYGAERVIIVGRRLYDKRSTVGAHNYISVHRVNCMIDETTVDYDAVEDVLKKFDYTPICVEHGGTLVRQFDFCAVRRPCLILGNEGFGLPKEFTSRHHCVSIPQRGVLRSFNVSSAAAIVIDETVAQLTS